MFQTEPHWKGTHKNWSSVLKIFLGDILPSSVSPEQHPELCKPCGKAVGDNEEQGRAITALHSLQVQQDQSQAGRRNQDLQEISYKFSIVASIWVVLCCFVFLPLPFPSWQHSHFDGSSYSTISYVHSLGEEALIETLLNKKFSKNDRLPK